MVFNVLLLVLALEANVLDMCMIKRHLCYYDLIEGPHLRLQEICCNIILYNLLLVHEIKLISYTSIFC